MPIISVVPVLVGPLQALLAILPAVLVALGGVVLAALKPSAIKKLLLLAWSQKLVVVPAAILIVLAVHYWPAIFPPAQGAWQLGQSDWPMWRGSPDRRAVATGENSQPRSGKVQWRFSDGSLKSFYSSPAVVGNRVYAIGSNYVPPISDNGAIYCLDSETGEIIWQFQAEGYRASFSSPSVSGRYLVVGEGLHWTADSRIFCIDLKRSAEEGRGVKAWSFRTASHVESSPCIHDGKVYVGAGDDGFYCLSLSGRQDGEAEIIWHVKGANFLDCEPSPVVHKGKVYFGLGKGGKAVVCLDATTGEQLWRRPAPYPVFASPAISEGKVVVGMGIGNYVNSAEEVAANIEREMLRQGNTARQAAEATSEIVPVGSVWCLNADTGQIIWKCEEMTRTVLGSPAIADGTVYVGSRDKHLYCLSLADGSVLGKFNARGPIVSGPAVGPDNVFVVTQTGTMFSLNRQTLAADWAASLNADTMSSPAVAGGHVYVGTNNGLLCVGTSQGEQQRSIWAGPGGGPGKSGWTDGSMIPEKASLNWSFAGELDGEAAKISSPLAYLDGVIYAGTTGNEESALVALTLQTEAGKVASPEVKWVTRAVSPIVISPAATDQAVLFVDGKPGDNGRSLHCLDADTGVPAWRIPVSPDASGKFLMTFDRLFVADRPDGLSCMDLSGHRLWSNSFGPLSGMPWIEGDLLFAAQGSPARLLAIDAPTGRALWSAPLEEMPSGGAVLQAGRVWMGFRQGASGYDPTNGLQTGSFACDGPVINMLLGPSRVAFISEGKATVAAVLEDGTFAEVAQTAETVRAAMLAGANLLYCDGASIRRLDTSTGQATLVRKSYPKYEGNMITPMIVVNSHILYATDKKGLVCLKPKRK